MNDVELPSFPFQRKPLSQRITITIMFKSGKTNTNVNIERRKTRSRPDGSNFVFITDYNVSHSHLISWAMDKREWNAWQGWSLSRSAIICNSSAVAFQGIALHRITFCTQSFLSFSPETEWNLFFCLAWLDWQEKTKSKWKAERKRKLKSLGSSSNNFFPFSPCMPSSITLR